MTRTLKKDVLLRIVRDPSPAVRKNLAGVLFKAVEKGDLAPADQRFAASIFAIAVDDPDPGVRKNLARLMSSSRQAPPEIVATLACGPEEISLPVLKSSPLLEANDLANLARGGSDLCRCVIASRSTVPPPVAGVIVKCGSEKACLVLAKNRHAKLSDKHMIHLIRRFGRSSKISDALIDRGMLPAVMSRQVMSNVSDTLRKLMVERNWASARRARSVTLGALENGTLDLSLRISAADLKTLIASLMAEGQLTPTLVLRSACAGYVRFVEAALSLMANLPPQRVSAMIRGRGGFGLRAVYAKAGLPLQAFPLFKIAISTYQELLGESGDEHSRAFHCRVIERVLTRYQEISREDSDQLMRMLEVFAADVVREKPKNIDQNIKKAA